MLDFLKKIFRKEEEIPEEKVSVNELDKWFEDKSKQILTQLDGSIKIIKDKINEEIEKTKQNSETLRNAELRNPKIPFRAKQLMEGNREAYIKRVGIFIKQIDLEKDYNDLLDFCNNFDSMLDDFGKSTLKPYHILQEFLANESSAIARNIKSLDNLIKEAKNKIKEADIDSIKKVKGDIALLNNKIKERESDKKELENRIKEKEKLIQSLTKTTEDIENLKKDEEYERLESLESEKEKMIKNIDEHKKKLIHSFSVIEMALKKFSRMAFENEKLIDKYLENPLILVEDKELKIIDVLKSLEKNILNNGIELKDRKKEKTLEETRRMDREFFDDFLKKYKELNEELKEINDKINKMDIQNRINELNKDKKNNELRLENINKEIENLKKEIDKEQIDNLKEKIQKKINNLLKIKVVIS